MMLNAKTLARKGAAAAARRAIHSRRRVKNPIDLPRALVSNFPVKKTRPADKAVNGAAPEEEEPLYSAPVTSAHAIDLEKGCPSLLDSAAIDPSTGSILHGRYGQLDDDATLGVPLEYLALLRHAAEGAAGLSKLNNDCAGTVLVYGATQASGFAAIQMAQSSKYGHTVVGVVDGQHSGNEDMVEHTKGLCQEPGTAVGQEYALAKKNFADLVEGISAGDDQMESYSATDCLEEFKTNLRDYADFYPDTMPAAVNPDKIKFLGMEKDKDQFRANMDTYLGQFQPGSPPISADQLDRNFSTDQYEIFRNKFWEQTTSVISGDESHFFSPPHIVQDLLNEPESKPPPVFGSEGVAFEKHIPFRFTPLKPGDFATGTEPTAAGPVAGAIIVATPDLVAASTAVASAGSLREKAEALQFLSVAQRDAFGAATSVAAQAKKAGAPVVCIGGSLPGIETAEPTEADVTAALAAMAIQDDGSTDMEYFIQAYRAGDFPFYADYAVHRASEPLAGPRQIVVTK